MPHPVYLIEGVSGSGKTSVATELERRGYAVVHGDRVLAYQGDPQTGAPIPTERRSSDPAFINTHHIWDAARVRAIIADPARPVTFFCGASRNRAHFVDLFDAVFLLEADWPTLERRLAARVDEWGSEPGERALVARLHATREDLPDNAMSIDATRPLAKVVDAILAHCGLPSACGAKNLSSSG
ncbi:AAA family ATPase [Devosia chinhatensis]|uniref:Nucleoside kinase n=1 Tax=Devosia chinhatensis TaxID=429727 RepID=A0A0F5FLD1_9HYPH|nr:AAA family ATPase [Devosia chinhatensis]KKB09651.1 nucleoside kinase [Devosia chinhatensis]